MKKERNNEEMCFYCGEEKSQVEIPNPNLNEDKNWKVCRVCEKIIKNQLNLTMGMIMKGRKNPFAEKIANEIISKAQEEIRKLSYESGKEVFSFGFGSEKRK